MGVQRGCDSKCRAKISVMRFFTYTEQLQYYYSCQIKCKIETAQIKNSHETCSGKFVDCSRYGGYDPTDPCHETCLRPKDDFEHEDDDSNDSDENTENDTLKSEVTTSTKSIIHKGKWIEVECRNQPIDCYKPGIYIPLEFPPEVNVKRYHKMHNRAPNGAYWKFDCNWIQKMIYENCWEGDDGKGNECTIWDRILFKKCIDTSAIAN